jgi:hypothetical protein
VNYHGPDCPGCRAESLTNEDRAFLARNGWRGPQHIIPELAPPPPPNTSGTLWLCGISFVLWMTAIRASAVGTLVLTILAAIGIALWWYTHNQRHDQPVDRCSWCRRTVLAEQGRSGPTISNCWPVSGIDSGSWRR